MAKMLKNIKSNIFKIIRKIISNIFYSFIASIIISQPIVYFAKIQSIEIFSIQYLFISTIGILVILVILKIIAHYQKDYYIFKYKYNNHKKIGILIDKINKTINYDLYCPRHKLKLFRNIDGANRWIYKCQKCKNKPWIFRKHEIKKLFREVENIISKKYGYGI